MLVTPFITTVTSLGAALPGSKTVALHIGLHCVALDIGLYTVVLVLKFD